MNGNGSSVAISLFDVLIPRSSGTLPCPLITYDVSSDENYVCQLYGCYLLLATPSESRRCRQRGLHLSVQHNCTLDAVDWNRYARVIAELDRYATLVNVRIVNKFREPST